MRLKNIGFRLGILPSMYDSFRRLSLLYLAVEITSKVDSEDKFFVDFLS